MSAQEPKPDLFAAILAQPDEDAPRLAYADCLDRNGQADRARFIRLQLEVSHLPPDHPRHYRASSEAQQLQRANHGWLGDREAKDFRWEFHRGFPLQVVCDSFKAFTENQRLIFAYPVLGVRFTSMRTAPRLAACPGLARLRYLDLSHCSIDDAGVRLLAGSANVANLTRLILSGNPITAEGVRSLAGSPYLGNLRSLSLSRPRNPYQDGSLLAAALAGSSTFAQLRQLWILGANLRDEGMRSLVESPHLTRLTSLELGGNGIGPAGIAALGSRECWPNLTHLGLGTNKLADAGAIALAGVRHWDRLASLTLGSNRIADSGVTALAGSAILDNLTTLDLGGNSIGTPGAIALAESDHVGSLTWLRLGGNLIGDEGALALGHSTRFRQLTAIDLHGNAIQHDLARAVIDRHVHQDPGRMNIQLRQAPPPVEQVAPPPIAPTGAPVDEDGLIQAIIDDPDDPTIRLVYADWLEENGDAARAELVRIQAVSGGRGGKVTPREKQLMEANAARWLGNLTGKVAGYRFSGGMLLISVGMRQFQARVFQEGAGLAFRQTRVHGLILGGSTVHWDRVADSPVLGHIHELHLSRNSLREKGVRTILASTRLTGLHTLSLQNNGVTERCLETLVSCTTLPRLKRLDLSSNYIYAQAIRQLLLAPGFLGRLTSLSLSGNWLGSQVAPLLLACPDPLKLRNLDLSLTNLQEKGVEALVGSALFAGLRSLRLAYNQLTTQAALSLAGASELRNLVYLDVSGNSIGDEGARALARSPYLSGVRELVLGWGQLSAECRTELQQELGDRLVG